MYKSLILLVCTACVGLSTAQVFGGGGCPHAVPQASFNLTEYLGDWYEIYKFYAAFESGQSCAKANYQIKPDGHIRIFNSGFKDNNPINATGDAYIPDLKNPAKLKLRFSSLAPYGDYWVLDTDYTDYTLIYSCSGVLGITHYEFAWILARQPTISAEVKTKLFNKVTAMGIDTTHFTKQDRSNCPDGL
ncbi:APOD-like protein [Mya arenaria]|uniref:Apolipoprotein D n=1 Tax=Mya arenaria TaxID=6604 RepID=A0ABY7ENU1_MYAAR|nr:apolipoprotein D-like [Mya arenaria]WAR11660.1 APOD-like protein [Mya arenaria]